MTNLFLQLLLIIALLMTTVIRKINSNEMKNTIVAIIVVNG